MMLTGVPDGFLGRFPVWQTASCRPSKLALTMRSVTKPKGPLPARVYWTRRLLALGLTLALVFGIGQLVGEGTSSTATPSARPADPMPSASSPAPSSTASSSPTSSSTSDSSAKSDGDGDEQKQEKGPKSKPEPTQLAFPTGRCSDSDVKVVPSLDGRAHAGRDVTITLTLSTLESPACTWEVSAESVVLRLTSGTDPIWTTQDCGDAIPRRAVVLRNDHPVELPVTWPGMRSDDGCTIFTEWAQPGFYHASAAAYGAEPDSVQFELLGPVTKTVTAKPNKNRGKNARDERN